MTRSMPMCTLHLTQPLSDYAVPEEMLTYRPLQADVGEERERRIKCYSKLTSEEQKRIAALEAHLEQEGETLEPDVEPFMLPYLFGKTSKDDTTIAAMRLCQTARWRRKTFRQPWVDSDFLSDLNTGCFYFGGRDKALRPLLIARIDRVLLQEWDHDRMIRLIVFMLEFERQHLFVPGVCEQHVLLIDLRKVGLLDVTSSRTLIGKIVSVISQHYVGMNYKILIVNPPASLQAAWGIMRGILSEGQMAKACVVTPESTILRDLFAPHQLERTYGGTRLEVKGPFYPFQFVPGPFDASSQGPDENAPADIHSRLLRPPWAVWKSDSKIQPQLKLKLKDDADKLPWLPSDASPRSIKTSGSFTSALSRSISFQSALSRTASFRSTYAASCCDATSGYQTVEEANHHQNGATPSTPERPSMESDHSDKQRNLSDQTILEDEAITCSLEVEKAAQNVPFMQKPTNDDPLATGSTDAPHEINPQGFLEGDDDDWGFTSLPDVDRPPSVVFFEVAAGKSRGTSQMQWCFWPFCCPTGPPS